MEVECNEGSDWRGRVRRAVSVLELALRLSDASLKDASGEANSSGKKNGDGHVLCETCREMLDSCIGSKLLIRTSACRFRSGRVSQECVQSG